MIKINQHFILGSFCYYKVFNLLNKYVGIVSDLINGVLVEVCEHKETGCRKCGIAGNTSFPLFPEVVHCDTKPRPAGKWIKISKDNDSLHFCQADAFGEIMD